MNKRKSAALLAAATINTIAVALSMEEEDEKSLELTRKYKKRQYVMKPDAREEIRNRLGHQNILAEMRLKDPHLYHNYLRMSAVMFDQLLSIVGPSITKSVNGPRMPINPSTRLALTMRYF